MVLLVAVVALGVLVAVALAVSTGMGARRRGAGWPLAVVSGLAFPVTWTVWYLRDERPFRRRWNRRTTPVVPGP